MNKTLFILLLLLYNLSVGQTQPNISNKKGVAFVKINSHDQGLLFYVDDSLAGAVTGVAFEIRAGSHKLKVSSITDSWTAVDWNWQGNIKADSVYIFNVETKRFLMLNTVPFGATVIINGNKVGTTPFMLEKTGEAVEIVMSNYMPVRLEATQLVNKEFIDIMLVNESPSEEIESSQMTNGIGINRDKIFTRTTYLLTGLAGIATVYFKFEADKAFKKLPDTILLEEQIELKNRINKYDDRAAVSFATFQAGFLYSIYRVITR